MLNLCSHESSVVKRVYPPFISCRSLPCVFRNLNTSLEFYFVLLVISWSLQLRPYPLVLAGFPHLGCYGCYFCACGCRSCHRWALPVICYPINMAIYPYPSFGVIFMIILHAFIIKNYTKLFSNYHPKFTLWVIYPFSWIYKNLYTNSLSLIITQLYRSKW